MLETQIFLIVLAYGLFMFWFGFKVHKDLTKPKKKRKR